MSIHDNNGNYGIFSFADGFKSKSEPTLREEAAKKPGAVINRLMRNKQWALAENIMDEFGHLL